ncbi:MAG: hypothetical protein AAFQ95_22580 [Cyanobacteria bacterium J06621_3]
MSINLRVQAEVIDITTDTPQPEDIFLVDTNIWLWQTYPNVTLNANKTIVRRSRDYSRYLRKTLSAGSQLKYSGLTLSELAHVIEKTERDIFKREQGLPKLSAKAYRHSYPSARETVTLLVKAAWDQVTSLATSADVTVDAELTQKALHRFQTQALDGYDLFLLEAISSIRNSPVQVLTDDMDYACVPGIQLFTQNRLVLEQAHRQGMLVLRDE